MARPITISDQQILDAARDVFVERGLRATTAEIARRAGCSEGSIFRRYESKEALFLAAMGARLPDDWFDQVCSTEDARAVRENVRAIAVELLDFFVDRLPRVLTLLGAGLQPSHIAGFATQSPPARAIDSVTRYFAAEKQRGRVGDADPEILARTLIGAVHFFAFGEVTGINARRSLTREHFLDGLVDMLVLASEPRSQ